LLHAAAVRFAEHSLLSAEALAQRAFELATVAAVRVCASDALARVLAAQGRWTDALALDTAGRSEHGELPERSHRMARCAMDAAQPELAAVLIARAMRWVMIPRMCM